MFYKLELKFVQFIMSRTGAGADLCVLSVKIGEALGFGKNTATFRQSLDFEIGQRENVSF